MLAPRIIPSLLIKNGGLVKTTNFQEPRYIGDPINAVRIFNEKEVDELVVLDIDASADNREPNYEVIEHLAAECRMPLCYGGGVKTAEQVVKIVKLGVEKVAMSSAIIERPQLISEAAEMVGNQSIVAVIDVKRVNQQYRAFTFNGSVNTGESPFELAKRFAEIGAGEIVVNSIDGDGVMQGYDFELVEEMKNNIRVPLTVLGGAGSLDDIKALFARFRQLGAAAGSLFVYKGKYRAVLINYPSPEQKRDIENFNDR